MSIADRAVYATQPAPLAAEIDQLLRDAEPASVEGDLLALIVPDSNLQSGGEVSAAAYKLLEGRSYETVLIVAPSHDGAFERLAICSVNRYRSPFGDIEINDAVRNELCDEDDDIYIDDQGHYHTEGVDVQLPFLQRVLGPDFKVVPIVMGSEAPALCRELGHAIGEVMYGHRMLVVASADLLSVEGDAAQEFETALESFDTSRLMHLLGSEQVRVEGMGAIIAAVLAAQYRKANRAKVLRMELPEGDRIGAMACALWRE
ncbi:MAG: AmmeMemoRadiSam system protein B [Rhodothermales bacterium]